MSGPVGTPVTIHLKGVGWTEYDNIYVATYDNAYMGYACGFNSQGDVVINFTASGRRACTSSISIRASIRGRRPSRSCCIASRSSPTPTIIRATRFNMPSQRGQSCNGNPSSFPCESGLAHDGHGFSLPDPASIQRAIPAWSHRTAMAARDLALGSNQPASAHHNWHSSARPAYRPSRIETGVRRADCRIWPGG